MTEPGPTASKPAAEGPAAHPDKIPSGGNSPAAAATNPGNSPNGHSGRTPNGRAAENAPTADSPPEASEPTPAPSLEAVGSQDTTDSRASSSDAAADGDAAPVVDATTSTAATATVDVGADHGTVDARNDDADARAAAAVANDEQPAALGENVIDTASARKNAETNHEATSRLIDADAREAEVDTRTSTARLDEGADNIDAVDVASADMGEVGGSDAVEADSSHAVEAGSASDPDAEKVAPATGETPTATMSTTAPTEPSLDDAAIGSPEPGSSKGPSGSDPAPAQAAAPPAAPAPTATSSPAPASNPATAATTTPAPASAPITTPSSTTTSTPTSASASTATPVPTSPTPTPTSPTLPPTSPIPAGGPAPDSAPASAPTSDSVSASAQGETREGTEGKPTAGGRDADQDEPEAVESEPVGGFEPVDKPTKIGAPEAVGAANLARKPLDKALPAKAATSTSLPAGRVGRFFARVDQAAGGYAVDLVLYALSAAFALVTALTSTLLPHRAWGSIAVWAYATAFLLAACQFAGYRLTIARSGEAERGRSVRALFGNGGRATLTWLTWGSASLLPLVVQAVQRADGRTDRAQEEVLVVERMGERLLADGTPYLSRGAIAALPADERLMGYSPYQPGMSIFGLPRAIAGDVWWTDARIWFALFTALILIAAVVIMRPRSAGRNSSAESGKRAASNDHKGSRRNGSVDRSSRRWQAFATVRALQAATVLPICALTLATGGDDIPVLAFCLLAFALAATDRYGWAGVAVGAAAACKLFALPVVAVLAVLAMATARGGRLLPGALGLPILVLVPPFQVDQDSFLENVIRFPLGHGLVTSPAQSPFPGYLIAQNVPDGRYIAIGLLLAVAAVITVRIFWVPSRTAASASSICGWGLLGAILLMPTTRFGYLLYPIAFLVWAGVLNAAHRNHTATSGPLGDTALYAR